MNKLFDIRRTMVFRSLALAGVGALAARHAVAAQPEVVDKAEGVDKAEHYRVVFQLNDADTKRLHLLLNNIKNVQRDFGKKNVTVEVVAFGPGVSLLTAESEVANPLLAAMAQGVLIVACENTMRAQQLKHNDMVSGVGFVPSGVAELIKRQSSGYAYIRT